MNSVFTIARKEAGMTLEEAAPELYVSRRSLWNYENDHPPNPDIVIQMAKLYNRPDITNVYCKKHCPIGKKYAYEILDNVDLNLTTILSKLRIEMIEAMEVIDAIISQSINCNKTNIQEAFKQNVQEFLDVEHNIEILKIRLHTLTDVEQMISEHNMKCINKNYCNKKAH